MCINTYIAIVEELVTFSMAASCILGQLDIHSDHVLSPHQTFPLHWAADGAHADTVKSLIEKEADVNCKDNEEVNECDCANDCGSV